MAQRTPEQRARDNESAKRYRDAHREEIRERDREYRKNPEQRERRLAYAREYLERPGVRERRRELERKRYQKPERREYMRKRNRDEYRKPGGRELKFHASIREKYGLTPEAWAKMFRDQGGICANPGCGSPAKVVDHDHTTGVVRGLLCSFCNTSIGYLGEDIRRVEGLAEYLRLHNAQPVREGTPPMVDLPLLGLMEASS